MTDAGSSADEAEPSQPAQAGPSSHNHGLTALTIGAIGVVFGDIGTSPLYAFREALGQAASDGLTLDEIIGVMSLALWALIVIVTLKYVVFLMRADNDGEGGVLALLALAQRGTKKRGGLVLALGAIGAALFYGDAVITPALSVLSAVEGLKTLPGIGQTFTENRILLIGLGILVGLFAIQSKGTAAVSRLFGPVCIVWFLAIAGIGLIHIADGPGILAAFLPWNAVGFVLNHGVLGLFVLGAVFLTVTGAEALTADMGHFGKRPIRLAWLALVFPALALNYLGQGAFAIKVLEDANRLGKPFANLDWFFLMTPDALRAPMVLLATFATIIASQAVITGAYSLSQQAMQLGLLPRLSIRQTSEGHAGQIYVAGHQLVRAVRGDRADARLQDVFGHGRGLWHRGDRDDGGYLLSGLRGHASPLGLEPASQPGSDRAVHQHRSGVLWRQHPAGGRRRLGAADHRRGNSAADLDLGARPPDRWRA